MTTATPCVLVVDDFPDGREMMAEYLAFRGHRVIQATEGGTALEIARLHLPAIILLDLTMPGMDGWKTAQQLKADPATQSALIIAVTANAFARDEQKALAAGCDAFIAKPFDLTVLGNAIDAILTEGRRALTSLKDAALLGAPRATKDEASAT